MKKRSKDIAVHIGNNPELDKLIQKAAFKAGYEWGFHNKKYNDAGILTHQEDYCLAIDEEGEILYGDTDDVSAYNPVGVKEFLDDISGLGRREFKLNDEYTAIVYKDKVIVGCQTFHPDSIKEIAKAIKELGG